MNINSQTNFGRISPIEAISDAWEAIKPQYWLFFGMSIVSMLMFCIPLVNILLISFMSYGFHYAMIRRLRGEQVEFSMLFKGFENFGQVAIASLLSFIPSLLQIFLGIVMPTSSPKVNASMGADPQAILDVYSRTMSNAFTPLTILVTLISAAWAFMLYFMLPLMADKNLDAISAFKLSAKAALPNIIWIILLSIATSLLAFAGVLALCVGVLFVSPVIIGSITAAYRQVFPDDAPRWSQNAPPSPNYYGSDFGTANNPPNNQQNYGQQNYGQQNYDQQNYGNQNQPNNNQPNNWQPPSNNDPKNW